MFTDEEVDDAVRRYLSTDVATNRLKSGSRDTLGAKEQVYDLVATALLLEPASYYYVIWLASNKLAGLINEQLGDMSVIIEAAPNASRQAKLLGPATELVNAKAAIVDLNAAFNKRTQGVSGSLGPGVERFRVSVERYIKAELVKNVVVENEVVPTGEELKDAIRSAWTRAQERHAEIYDLATSIGNAIQTYRNVRLPDSAVKKIVGRIENKIEELQETLGGSTAIRDSRIAMLDLLAMRALLARCSNFRAPSTALAPLGTDPATCVLLGGSGVPATLLGTVASPYNYAEGSVLNLTVNGGTPVSVNLPGTSGAIVVSEAPSFPAPTGAEVAVSVDGGTPVLLTTSAWASGPTAAAALSVLAGVTVTWNGADLVYRSDSAGDVSRLQFLGGSLARENFLSWAFGGAVASAVATPVPAASLLQLFPPSIEALVEESNIVSFVGERVATLGQEDYLWHRRAAAADLVSDGSTTLVATATDFEALGAVPGDVLVITAPSAVQRTVVSVKGAVLVVDLPVPAAVNTYYMGPDYSAVPAGARVQLVGAEQLNTGYYRVVSGAAARLVLDRDIPSVDVELSVTVTQDRMRLTARGTTTSSGIGATASAGATALGLAIGPEKKASLDRLQITGVLDFVARGVRAGDHLVLTSPAAITYDTLLTAVEPKILTFDPPVPYEASNWLYAVSSFGGAAYDDLAEAVDVFLGATDDAASDVDQAVTRLLRGARYSTELQNILNIYGSVLETLLTATDDYAIPRDIVIDQVVRTFAEEGYDRALDLFVGLRLDELFAMSDDGVSYSSWLTRQSATVAREVVPITKDPRDLSSQWRTLTAQSTSFDPRAEPDRK
jgi:hypothetical protein